MPPPSTPSEDSCETDERPPRTGGRSWTGAASTTAEIEDRLGELSVGFPDPAIRVLVREQPCWDDRIGQTDVLVPVVHCLGLDRVDLVDRDTSQFERHHDLVAVDLVGALEHERIRVEAEQERLAVGADRYLALSPEQRRSFRKRFQRWERLPPERRAMLEQRLEQFRQLSPEEQQALRERHKRFRKMSPERRRALRDRFQRLSPDERRAALQRFRERRQRRLN